MEYINAKTIITKTKSSNWFGTDYNMNIYRGCCHGCIYCDSRSSCYNIKDFNKIAAKDNALSIIKSQLKSKKTLGVIGTGSMSDPYNPIEKKLNLTRGALEIISNYGFGVNIITKSDLILKDIDVLKEINKYAPVCVGFTITTYDDYLCSKIEPSVSLSSKRFKAMNELSSEGIFTGVLLMPILPFINDTEENIISIINKTKQCGGKFIYPYFGVTLREGQREYFYNELDKLFPSIREKYIETYGYKYEGVSLKSKSLWNTFKLNCHKEGILYKMPDIIKAYKYRKESYEQLTLI
ncbi:SPL family radical SAM protein [Clostridium hydrogeniformans]|uniref:SPL family radical SAM protein n=1 Tax=Clostridium hydrogeniformans TaxID=349933 RepID=UPI000486A673|nr:radical SAM protein [Clostridium hydrogeniformans]